MKKHILKFILLLIPFSVLSQTVKEHLKKFSESSVTIVYSNNENKYASGFILEKGKVITNLHVIEGLTSGYVTINGDKEKHKINGYFAIDNQNDLAILSVPTLDGIPLEIAESTPKVGEKIYSFENPKKSSKMILEGNVEYISLFKNSGIIKTTISTFPGNSGSAVINSQGKVVGILFAGGFIMTNEINSAGGYAVHLDFIKKIKNNKNNKIKKLNLPYGAYHYLNESSIKLNSSNFNGAIYEINKSIKINPNLPILYSSRGLIRMKMGQIKSAISDFNKSIEIDPKHTIAYYNKGLAKSLLKNYKGALSDYNRAIEINPKYSSAYTSRGATKASLKDFKGAIIDCDLAIEFDPENALSYIARGGIKFFSNNKEGACLDFQKAKSLGNTDATKFIEKFCK